MAIDHAEVRRIAQLAHLELDDAFATALVRDLQSILDHVAMLDELDLDEIPPTTVALAEARPLREDTPRASLSSTAALSSAPDKCAGYFRVPRMLGE